MREGEKKEEDLIPSTVEDIVQDLERDSKVVKAGRYNYKIRKASILELAMEKVFSLPAFKAQDKSSTELVNEAMSFLKNPENRLQLMNDLILRCTISPKVVKGPTDAKKNQISIEDLTEKDKLFLAGQIFDFCGFSTQKSEFFPKAAGEDGPIPGSDSQTVQSEAQSVTP